MKKIISSNYLKQRKCFYSSSQSYVAVEPPPDNLPTFLTTDVLRDPKKRAVELYMPYRNISYEEELKLKQRQLESRFQSVAKTLYYDRALHPSIRKLIRTNDTNLCSIREIQRTSATSEYLTSCIADLGKTRSGDLALGIANRIVASDYSTSQEDGQSMLVLPIDDVDIYKKRDRLIVKHYNDFLQKEAKDISNIEYVLHHWRPIRIYTNKKDQKLVVIGYFDRKTNNSERQGAQERLHEYFQNGLGRECQIDHLYFEQRPQRWPIIINETSYEHIIGDDTKPFYYDLFGMKFEANLQSYGISNLTAYETIYAEILKLCHLEPNSTIFLQYFSDLGVLPLIAAQHVDQCYGLDPNRFAIKTAIKTQEKYPHAQNVQFSVCTNRDEFQSLLTKIESNRKKNASLTCVFGPMRYEVERQDLRQNKSIVNALRECDFIDRLIVVNRNVNSSVLHLLYSLSGGESSTHKISGPPFKPVLIIPFDANPRSGLLPDFLTIYERD
jgi:tRNA/tmRNA/rRNA uracil-C5-methylase (TrmA/RlmC/RlmD family)